MYELETFIDPVDGIEKRILVDHERQLSIYFVAPIPKVPKKILALKIQDKIVTIHVGSCNGEKTGNMIVAPLLYTIHGFGGGTWQLPKYDFRDEAERQQILELIVEALFEYGPAYNGAETRSRGKAIIIKYKDQTFSSEDLPA